MPITLTYPGVYVEEVPSGVRTITGVATSITAFVGRALRGPANTPLTLNSFADFERSFGPLTLESALGYAVRDFFVNGGGQAIVVRVDEGLAVAMTPVDALGPGFRLAAASGGEWGNQLRVEVDYDTKPATPPEELFNLTITDLATRVVERHLNLSTAPNSPRYYPLVLENSSSLARAARDPDTGAYIVATSRPMQTPRDEQGNPNPVEFTGAQAPEGAMTSTQILGSENDKTGLYALEKADIFNLLVVPPYTGDEPTKGDVEPIVVSAAAAYSVRRRAILIVDPPSSWTSQPAALSGLTELPTLGTANRNAALYFPRLVEPNPLRENQLESFAPSGAVAGVIARTDAQRGIWKAPAGLDAGLVGVMQLDVPLTDKEIGDLNQQGINAIRSMPAVGRVIWGARTLAGADRLASEWKYLPVRRTALFIAESLYRGTQWAVFEPNGETLWAQLRLSVGAFMNNLFRQGAFFGQSAREAYFVKCDGETTTQNDINLGIVNIHVGFAPLKPAEFVVIKLQQMAGEVET